MIVDPLTRFMRHVSVEEVGDVHWIWQGALPGGFRLNASGSPVRPWRAAWTLFVGKIRRGHLVYRTCTEARCVLPAHLRTATLRKRRLDLKAAGTLSARLLEADVLAIRERYADGEGAAALVAAFVVTSSTIYHVATGRTWKHLGGPRTRRMGGVARVVQDYHLGDGVVT